jgi:hypothetical protein
MSSIVNPQKYQLLQGKNLYGQGKPQQTGMNVEIYSIPTYTI